MAEEVSGDSGISAESHGDMPFRLGDIVLDMKFADLHPMLSSVDKVRQEWKFQFKLLRIEWGKPQFLTMLTGIVAFLLGSVSADLFTGGDPKITGLDGLSGIDGFGFSNYCCLQSFGFGFCPNFSSVSDYEDTLSMSLSFGLRFFFHKWFFTSVHQVSR